MSKPKISIAFADLVMRGTKVTRTKSTFLGYADATLNITFGGVEVIKLRVRNMTLKVVNGKFRMDFHSELGDDGEWYPTCFPLSGITRSRLTAAIKLAYAARKRAVRIAA